MFKIIYNILNRLYDDIINQLYDGNIAAFKADPIVGTILSTGTIWGIDYHLALTKIVGTGDLATMSMAIAVIGPPMFRYYLHKWKVHFPIIGKWMEHDKKGKE